MAVSDRPWLPCSVVLLTAMVVGADSPSLIEEVFVLDPSGTECLSCPSGEVPEEVADVVAAADMDAYVAWLKTSFDLKDDWWDRRFKRGDPSQIFMSFDMGTDGGVRYQAAGMRVEYEESKCWLWDCYTSRMWRFGDSGRRLWKRKVPFADAPVEPFVVDDFILYVGRSSRGLGLVILDAATGRVVETFTPEGEPHGFHDAALMFAPSFYRNGYVYLKGYTEGVLDRETKRAVEEVPAKTYVLKVLF